MLPISLKSMNRGKRPVRSNNPSSKQLDATKEQYASAFKVAEILAGDGTEKPTGPEDLANPNADIFPTSNGHKKVVTETTKPPLEDDEDPDLGLRSIDVVARVVQKDMWQEESKALERRALEAGNRSSRKRPVRSPEKTPPTPAKSAMTPPAAMGLRMSEATADMEKSSSTKRAAKFAEDIISEKSHEESDLGTSILMDVSAMQQTIHDMNGLPFRNLNKNKGGIKDMTKSSVKLLEITASRAASRAASKAPSLSASLAGTSLNRSSDTLAEIFAQSGVEDFSEEETAALMDSLRASPNKSSPRRHRHSNLSPAAAAGSTLARLSEAAGALTGNDLELHNMLQTATGGAPKLPGPPSDGGSSLKSLEYSQVLNLTVQELAWQAQLTTAAAAAADPEMTTAEIGRAPEYHVDYQNDKKQVRELIDKKSNQKWASAKSFIGKMAQDRAREKKTKEGWEPLSDTHEYRLAPNGVLEVRKKGMWDETEEQRQKRLAGRKTMGEKVRGAMAAYMGWDKEELVKEKRTKSAGQLRAELTAPVPFDLESQIHMCETLSGHQGVIRAMATVQNRVCVGGTDGKVRVWRHWNEYAELRKKRSKMKKSIQKLKSLDIKIAQSAMYHEIAAEGDDGAGDDEEEEQQTCEWQLQQVLEHNSAITAIVEATLQIKEHGLNEPMMAVATRNGCLFLWSTADTKTWVCAKEIRVASIILCMTYHEGRILAGCDDGGLHAWRLSDMEHGIIEGHEAAIWSIALVDEFLVSGSSDGNLKIWQHDEVDDTYDHIVSVNSDTGGIWSISNQTQIITAADDEMLHVIMQNNNVWDLVNTFEHGHRGPVTDQSVVNINYLVTCSPGRGAHIKGWDRRTWECLWEITDEIGPCWSMLQIDNSLIFGGSEPTLTVFRCFVPSWLVTILEKEREMEMQEMPEADAIFSSTVFGEEYDSLGSMSDSFAQQLSKKRSQMQELSGRGMFSSGLDASSQGSILGSSIPEAELCESPQHHGKGVTRNLMLA